MTAIERFKAIKNIGTRIEVPFEVRRFFGDSQKTIDLGGFNDISIGEDFGSLDQVRNAIAWYVTQFGGKVQWEK